MKIGVVGAGTMGNGIAQVAAFGGHDVILCDVSNQLVEKGLRAQLRSGSIVTGQQYVAVENSVINWDGRTLIGNVPGTISSGGQFIR